MLDYFGKLNKNIIDQIQYRGTMVTGVITADNGDGTYAVKIAQADESYPYVETAFPDMVFGVDEVVLITFEYGNKEMPRILGYAKRISQHPIDVESDYSGEGGDPITTVETLDAYSMVLDTAYLEGKISLSEGTGNCTRKGFRYGLTTSYGLDIHTDGSYGEGAFALQISGLASEETYHFQAYVIDADDNEQVGEDKTFITPKFIIMGSPAIARSSYHPGGFTHIAKENLASVSGKITSIELWAYSDEDMDDVIVATFQMVELPPPDGWTATARDHVHLADIPSGSKVTRTVDINFNPISLNVVAGDYIGVYWLRGNIEFDDEGVGTWTLGGDQTSCVGKNGWSSWINRTLSLYGMGK